MPILIELGSKHELVRQQNNCETAEGQKRKEKRNEDRLTRASVMV